MSKLLFVYEHNMPTVSILKDCFYGLPERYALAPCFMPVRDVKPRDLAENDVVVFIRPDNVLSAALAKRAKEAGCFVFSHCDDDLLNLPDSVPSIPWKKSGLKKTFCSSHAMWTSNPYLAEKYSKLTVTGRKLLMNTVVASGEIKQARELLEQKNEEIIKLVYAAAPDHLELFDTYIRPVMPALAEKFADKLSFSFVSVRPELPELEGKIKINYFSGMPLLEYRKFMRRENFDIGVAPLHDNDFSKCKYFNKFLEYSLQGTVGVYSNTEPYTYVVKEGVNGFLADNTVEAWENKLSKAIENATLRKKCVENAIFLLEENFSEDNIFRKILAEFPEIEHYSKPQRHIRGWKISKIIYVLLLPCERFYQATFYLKKQGIRRFVVKLRTHFRERNAYRNKSKNRFL